MSLTQIPLQELPPPPAPEKKFPEQGDLFDAGTWESAYREMHDFPTLLIQARDELARSRKREAFWMSLVAHFILILLFANSNRLAKFLPHRTVMIVANSPDKKDLTFLELPPDAQKITKPPKTNVLSDKTRIAESRAPKVNQQQLKKLLDAMKAGRPTPAPQPQQPPAAAQAQPPQQQPQPKPAAPTPTAKLQVPQARVHDDLMSFAETIVQEERRRLAEERGQALAPATQAVFATWAGGATSGSCHCLRWRTLRAPSVTEPVSWHPARPADASPAARPKRTSARLRQHRRKSSPYSS